MDGIPTVRPRRPLPHREEALPGTKPLRTPNDGWLPYPADGANADKRQSRMATVLGWAAMIYSVVFLVLLALVNRLPDAGWPNEKNLAMLVMISLGSIHLLAIFSQILSTGRYLLGALALPALYAGFVLLVVLEYLCAALGI